VIGHGKSKKRRKIDVLNEEQRRVLNGISTKDGLEYFSGYDLETKNSSFPLIYYNNGGFSVIGPGYRYWCNNLPDAVRAYEKFFKHSYLLKESLKKIIFEKEYT